jgi:hypothetical protein
VNSGGRVRVGIGNNGGGRGNAGVQCATGGAIVEYTRCSGGAFPPTNGVCYPEAPLNSTMNIYSSKRQVKETYKHVRVSGDFWQLLDDGCKNGRPENSKWTGNPCCWRLQRTSNILSGCGCK